jgi:hypothetical protein
MFNKPSLVTLPIEIIIIILKKLTNEEIYQLSIIDARLLPYIKYLGPSYKNIKFSGFMKSINLYKWAINNVPNFCTGLDSLKIAAESNSIDVFFYILDHIDIDLDNLDNQAELFMSIMSGNNQTLIDYLYTNIIPNPQITLNEETFLSCIRNNMDDDEEDNYNGIKNIITQMDLYVTDKSYIPFSEIIENYCINNFHESLNKLFLEVYKPEYHIDFDFAIGELLESGDNYKCLEIMINKGFELDEFVDATDLTNYTSIAIINKRINCIQKMIDFGVLSDQIFLNASIMSNSLDIYQFVINNFFPNHNNSLMYELIYCAEYGNVEIFDYMIKKYNKTINSDLLINLLSYALSNANYNIIEKIFEFNIINNMIESIKLAINFAINRINKKKNLMNHVETINMNYIKFRAIEFKSTFNENFIKSIELINKQNIINGDQPLINIPNDIII